MKELLTYLLKEVSLLPLPRRLCFYLFLCVCLLTELLNNNWSNVYEILCTGWTIMGDQLIGFLMTSAQGQSH